MLVLGIDLGTSFIKASVYDSSTSSCIASIQYPETETPIISKQSGWAEQSPTVWWKNIQNAIILLHQQNKYNPEDIQAIGIAYQMHGLVCVDEHNELIRDSIIWCDSRAVGIGNTALSEMGEAYCVSHLLNSPANFTASKLAWVKQNEPELFSKIKKIMLPGDYIAMKLTGEISTTISALSEGIFWDFKNNCVSTTLMEYFGFDQNVIPDFKNSFDIHGQLSKEIAFELNLKEGIPVSYKAGDQPNNALSLNVMKSGDVAATAGTSGVIYAVTDELFFDKSYSVNTFAHVNYSTEKKSLGVLMCINGTGIAYKYIKQLLGENLTYEDLNAMASNVAVGSEGVVMLPFGNGAERIFNNKTIGSHLLNINFNIHTKAHIARAALEGIAFAFHYGLKIMTQNGIQLKVIKAPKANLFLSEVFTQTFVNITGLTVELYECDGSVGAAKGAAIGASFYKNVEEAFTENKPIAIYNPEKNEKYLDSYKKWEHELHRFLQ
jgi:xylulokinase